MAAIVVIAKDPLPVVAAVHDVVTRFLRPLLVARGAWHRQASVSIGCVQCHLCFPQCHLCFPPLFPELLAHSLFHRS